MHVRPRTALPPFVCLATALFVSTSATAQSTQPAASSAPAAQPQAAPAAQAQPAPAARVPVFNRANEHLPSWLRVRGEFRERIEGFESGGFVDDRDDYYALSRVRLNVAVTAKPWLSFQTNLHDARVGDKEVGPVAAPFRAPFDIRMAFADVGTGKSPAALRLGRQELAFGEQRLLGHLAWVNTGRVWDGGARHAAVEAGAGGRLRRVAGALPARRLGPQRLRQPPLRCLRQRRRADTAGHGGAVRDLPPRREPGERARAARHAAADHRRGSHRRQAAGAAGLRRRDGGAARQPGPGRRERVGRATGRSASRCPARAR